MSFNFVLSNIQSNQIVYKNILNSLLSLHHDENTDPGNGLICLTNPHPKTGFPMPHKAEPFKKLCKINYQKQKNKGAKSYLTLKITPPDF